MEKYKPLQSLTAFIVGGAFAVGLGVAGMTQPQKVIGFLQWGKDWDISLMFVMIGAISIHAISYRLIRGRQSPLLDTKWYIPQSKEITKSLIIGSLMFGFGWGLGGYCPGPALASLGAGSHSANIFVVTMIMGMGLHWIYSRWLVQK